MKLTRYGTVKEMIGAYNSAFGSNKRKRHCAIRTKDGRKFGLIKTVTSNIMSFASERLKDQNLKTEADTEQDIQDIKEFSKSSEDKKGKIPIFICKDANFRELAFEFDTFTELEAAFDTFLGPNEKGRHILYLSEEGDLLLDNIPVSDIPSMFVRKVSKEDVIEAQRFAKKKNMPVVMCASIDELK